MKNEKRNINLDEDCPVCSTGEMTGLIPSGQNSQTELEAYNEMFSFIPKAITKSDKQANAESSISKKDKQ